jgi:hypothetical protein
LDRINKIFRIKGRVGGTPRKARTKWSVVDAIADGINDGGGDENEVEERGIGNGSGAVILPR